MTPRDACQELKRRRRWVFAGWLGLIVVLGLCWRGADIRPWELVRNSGNIAEMLGGFVPPDFQDWKVYAEEMWITVQIAVWGTFLAVVCAIPCGLLSSSNVVPWWIVQPTRRVMDAARSIHEMVFALLFVAAVGLGPFAGVLALFVHTTGVLAKLFAEAVEAIDPRPVEGIRAAGARPIEEIAFGIVPQVLPLWISYSLYRFESNVRSATILGIVGAGGIGMILWDVIRSFNYQQTAAVLLIILASVTLLDFLSALVRKRFI